MGGGTGIDYVWLGRVHVDGKDLEDAARGVRDLFGDADVEDPLPVLSAVGRSVYAALPVRGWRGSGKVDRTGLTGNDGEAFLPAEVE